MQPETGDTVYIQKIVIASPEEGVAISDTDKHTNAIMGSYCVRDCRVASLLAMTAETNTAPLPRRPPKNARVFGVVFGGGYTYPRFSYILIIRWGSRISRMTLSSSARGGSVSCTSGETFRSHGVFFLISSTEVSGW